MGEKKIRNFYKICSCGRRERRGGRTANVFPFPGRRGKRKKVGQMLN